MALTVLLTAVWLLEAARAQTSPQVITEGNVACTVGSSVTCTTEVSAVTPLPVIVAVTNGQNADPSQAQTYPVIGTITGAGGVSGTVNLFAYGSFGQQPNDTYPSLPYVQGGPVTLTNQADLTVSDFTASNLLIDTGALSSVTQVNVFAGGGALVALSVGGPGFPDSVREPDAGNFDGAQGGTVTLSNQGSLTVNGNGSLVAYPDSPIPVSMNALAAISLGGDGAADKTGNTDYAGDGGAGGNVTVTNASAVTVTNSDTVALASYGIFALSQGGIGGNEKNYAAGVGGDGGTVSVTNAGSIDNSAINGIGIVAASFGGASDFDDKDGGDDASGAGDGGAVEVTLESGSSITMSGTIGIGILAISAGGDADNLWQGSGGDVTVTIEENATLDTTGGGSLSVGVLAISAGSVGSVLPFETANVNVAFPGTPGEASVTNNGTVTSSGSMAVGIAALSVGGASIVTNAASSGSSTLGNVASGYGAFDAQSATVVNNGSITTLGSGAHGIVALSVGGGGGLLNLESANQVAILGSATTGSAGGNGAAVSVTNTGSIVTGDGNGGGAVAIGIVAQSIGGGGGSSNAPAFFVGGSDTAGSGGGDGGTVTVATSSGSTIATYDIGALGILAQSVGGGGGNGANAAGIFAATGGTGGNGGDGGTVTVNLLNQAIGGILTAGDFAVGLLAQSVGGGGGHGGHATAASDFLSVSVGGIGGNGGAGGTVEVANQSTIVTAGNQSLGLLAQSVGGGGGHGGAAQSYDVGLLTIAIAAGGAGGDGGAGGAVTVTNDYHIYTACPDPSAGCSYVSGGTTNTVGADAAGIVAQSIGGGGGHGGAATATSLSLPSEEVPLTLSFDVAVGGSGGSGGGADSVTVANAGQVYTGGDGAYGILAQSIGGGGGNGGDSTASAYAIEGTKIPSVKIAVAVGGSGGSGGDGGAVQVTNGETATCVGCDGQILTVGQNATGILAQSIGGGGGTGNSGNASASSPNLGDDTGTSWDVTVGVGGVGGTGGGGGTVEVTNDAGSSIVTLGSGAQGILAQSIGGGGGAAGGGSAASSGDSYQLNLSIGGSGGTGNDGGAVTVENGGSISTGAFYTNAAGLTIVTGGDGVGILAQSIGGGGGSGGSSDAAATIDTRGQVLDALNAPSNSYSANVAIGGSGGAAGDGGEVEVGNAGSILTLAIRAYGILAQSVGGGGGSGGAASSTSNSVIGGPSADKAGTYGADLAIGGSGAAAGDGGEVSVGNGGSIVTAGYGAHALFAQSVGGGGGVGAEGTVDNTTTVGLGAGGSGNGAAAGDGGTLLVEDEGTLVTAGDDAYALLAQSIGGGGGAAGVGCSNSVQVGPLNTAATLCLGNDAGSTVSTSIWNDASDYTLDLGGVAGASGDGGSVTVTKPTGAIVTTGARAHAIVAQSIGGGGGLAAAADVNLVGVALDTGENGGLGGAVSVVLGSEGAAPTAATLTTYGAGAFGIVAQSIGGGGGIAGDLSLNLAEVTSNTLFWTDADADDGGDVDVTVNGNLTTFGANAHGIVAQSIGGGGGLVGIEGTLTAGNALTQDGDTFVAGSGGEVTVDQQGGTILASGAGAIAIFAQSSGNIVNQGQIQVTIGGTVQGGTGTEAAGLVLAGGISLGSLQAQDGLTNSVTVAAGGNLGTVDGIAGWALLAIDGLTSVVNDGTVTGSIDLGTGAAGGTQTVGTIASSGTFNSGARVNAASLANSGTLAVGGIGNLATTDLTGAFTQTAGVLALDLDVLQAQAADLLAVGGTATLGGTIAPNALAILPGSYTVLTAASLESTATAESSLLFDWQVLTTATSLTLSPSADFIPTSSALSTNELALATHLQNAWNLGGSDELAPLFGGLSQLNSGGDYEAALESLTPESIVAHASDQVVASRSALNAMLSCPQFEADGMLLGEGSCLWGKAIGGHISRQDDGSTPGYGIDGVSLRGGGQGEIAPDWYLSGTAAYTMTWAKADSGLASSDGEGFDLGLALKHTSGPWLFAAGFSFGYGWYDNERRAALEGDWQSLSSESQALTLGGRLRVAYELPFESWYLRPYADFDLLYSHMPGYSESGDNALALEVEEQSHTTFAFTPMLEAGGRIDAGDGWILRPFLAGGLTLLSDNSWSLEASLQGAPEGTGSFTTESHLPRLLGNLDLGLQLYRNQGFELRLEYGLQAGQDYLAQGGGARVAYRF